MPAAITNFDDIVGQKFGKLEVKYYIETIQKGRQKEHYYSCNCDCGTTNIRTTRHLLIKGDKTSCGCAHKDAGNRTREDLTGRVFHRWTVLKRAPNRYSASGKSRSTMWTCKCSCGTIKDVGTRALKTGMSKSCGCLQKEVISETLTDNLTGKRFVNLVVVKKVASHCREGQTGGFNARWLCQCDCGNQIETLGFSLKNGDTTSCGCSKMSKYEVFVEQYLTEIGYVLKKDFYKEKTFKNLKGLGGQSLRFDFYLKSRDGRKILIECQGEQHYRPTEWYGGVAYFDKLQIHDEMKRNYAAEQGYELIEVLYNNVLYENVVEVLKSNNVN